MKTLKLDFINARSYIIGLSRNPDLQKFRKQLHVISVSVQ
jgi:hypothetical protein